MTSQSVDVISKQLHKKIAEFRNTISGHQARHGRRAIDPAIAVSHIRDCLDLMKAVPENEHYDLPQIDLSGVEFILPLTLPEGRYPGLDLSNAQFDSSFIVSNCHILGSFTLTSAVVSDGAQPIEFKDCSFEHLLIKSSNLPTSRWENIVLNERKDKRFGHVFENTTLGEFSDITIYGDARFVGFHAHRVERVLCYADTEWQNLGIFNITKSKFLGVTRILGGIQQLHINNVDFHKPSVFDGSVIASECSIISTRFLDTVSFQSTKFNGPVYFADVSFSKPPKFYNAEVFADASLRTCTFGSALSIEDANAYSEIRKHFPAEDGRFFALEQRSLANAATFSFNVALSRLYDWLSEYGQSTSKPFWWMVCSWISFSFFYWHSEMFYRAIAVSESAAPWAKTIWAWLGYSLQNLLNPLGLFSRTVQFEAHTWWVAALGVLESLITTAIAALWFLAIRRRFRKGSE